MKFKSRKNLFALIGATFLFISFSSSFPTGRTEAPGDGSCANCHSGGSGFNGTIDISGLPGTADGGQVYSLTVDVDVTNGSPMRAGFSIVALRDSDNSQAGTWSNEGPSSELKTSGGRQYFGHQPTINFGGGTNVSWEADWEAPAVNDDVTFYMITVLGNGSGSGGDRVITNELTLPVQSIDPIEVTITNINGVSCNGDNDGTASAEAMGGTAPYTFEWSSGEDTADASNLSGGTNTVTVTDDTGTSVEAEVTIPEPDEIEIDPEVNDVSCFGGDDGEIELNPMGGTGTLRCDWGPLGTDCDIQDLFAGSYFVTVTDENNCQLVEEVEVRQPNAIDLQITAQDAGSGADGSVFSEPNGGTPPYTFEWSNGFNDTGLTSEITNLNAGTYSVIVTYANGCEEEGSAVVSGTNCAISINTSVSDVLCFGDSTGLVTVDLMNAANPVSYEWSDGSTNSQLENAPAGNYALTVTDANNCTETVSSIIVSQPDTLQSTIVLLVNPACDNAMNGRISLVFSGGVMPYDLNWSNGLTADTTIVNGDTLINLPDTLVNLIPGTYGYTLTDANDCEVVDSITLMNGDVMPPIVMLQEANVILDEDGFANALDFSAVDNGSFDNCGIVDVLFDTGDFSCADIGIQNYDVTVFDGNGNSAQATATIVVEDVTPPVLDCSASAVTINTCGPIDYPIPTATDNCDVPIIALESGVAPGSSVPSGTYMIVYSATDLCGNASECSFDLVVDNNFNVNVTTSDASCGASDGAIEVIVTGGVAPYTIEPANLTDLAPGDYNITVSDSGDCSVEVSATILEASNNLVADINTTDITCQGFADGSVEIIVSGGSGDYDIEVSGNPDLQALNPGDYTVNVTDNVEGCTLESMFTILEPEALMINVDDITYSPCDGSIDDIQYTITGGTEPYSIFEESLSDGIEVVIEDANGCSLFISEENQMVDDTLSLEIVEVINSNSGQENGSIDVEASGGTPPYSYTWFDNTGTIISQDEDLTGLAPGDYSVNVVDANGCFIAGSFVTIDEISSIAELDEDGAYAKVYPNPVSEFINVEFTNGLPSRIEVYNIHGQSIAQYLNIDNKMNIDVSTFDSGYYVIKLDFEDQRIVKNFIKL